MKHLYQYAAYHVDENGYKINPALLEIYGERKEPGKIVTDESGYRFMIDYCMNDCI